MEQSSDQGPRSLWDSQLEGRTGAESSWQLEDGEGSVHQVGVLFSCFLREPPCILVNWGSWSPVRTVTGISTINELGLVVLICIF